MKIHLRHKSRNKGLSTVVGAVIVFAIIFTVIAGYFISVQHATNTRAELDQQASAESLTISVLPVSSQILVTISNTGPAPIQMVSILVSGVPISIPQPHCSSSNPPNCLLDDTSAPIAIQPAGSVAINTLITNSSDATITNPVSVKVVTILGTIDCRTISCSVDHISHISHINHINHIKYYTQSSFYCDSSLIFLYSIRG